MVAHWLIAVSSNPIDGSLLQPYHPYYSHHHQSTTHRRPPLPAPTHTPHSRRHCHCQFLLSLRGRSLASTFHASCRGRSRIFSEVSVPQLQDRSRFWGWKPESRLSSLSLSGSISICRNFGDLSSGLVVSHSVVRKLSPAALALALQLWSCAAVVGYFKLATHLRMTLRSIVRDLRKSFRNLSRRFKAKTSSTPGRSGRHTGKSSDELQDGGVVIQQSSWASLPPEVLRDVLKRLKQDGNNWPSPKDVVACASVCTTWRDMCKYIVRNPEFCGKITLPASLKQPGPRDGLIQCFIKRDKSKQTYHLYMSFSVSAMLDDNGKFLLSARRIRHMTYNGYTISMDSKNISQSGSGYIGMLR
ncbi:hypothetical protein QYE76_047333 [Lolium multiflorum]|uniref:Uncharacterized protein n=1 Tax=Lolium multiflorum TaxID=4521 RepID=A0AAD8TPN6_LOLMU|nr:hypothetical protein QYE76_047333 [Lolium multiflorum]